jgi:uncharacterized protein YneF (UPF0154 family)
MIERIFEALVMGVGFMFGLVLGQYLSEKVEQIKKVFKRKR